MVDEKIEIENLPGNSHAQKKEESEEDTSKKIIKKVASGKRIIKKKSFGEALSDVFFGDTTKSVGSYILFDVLIPAAKSTISDMISNGIEMLLYGEPRGGRRRDRDRGSRMTHISYSDYYDRDRDRNYDRGRDRPRTTSRFRLDEIVLESRVDAEEVLQSMYDILDQYNAVSVSDFLELVDMPNEYTDLNFGWTRLTSADVKRVRDGYILDLPAPRPLPR